MSFPALHFSYRQGLAPRVIFIVALLVTATVLGMLKAHWWHDAIVFALIALVRVTSRSEVL